MKEYYSPLRYPGGKGKVIPSIKSIIDKNGLVGLDYAEPFAGGASVALALVMDGYCENAYINDKDRAIYAFWSCVLRRTSSFIDKIENTPLNMDIWHQQKEIFESRNPNLFDLGFATFFLNRTNRSGILKAGVIGGKNQDGIYSLSERFNKTNLVKRIEAIARHRRNIHIYNLDGVDFLVEIANAMRPRSFIYLDPPYYNKGKDLYLNHFKHQDHEKVRDYINGVDKFNWVISYDDNPEIKKIYSGFRKKYYNLSYSLMNATEGKEILIVKRNLIVPLSSFKS